MPMGDLPFCSACSTYHWGFCQWRNWSSLRVSGGGETSFTPSAFGFREGWQCPVCAKVHAPWVAGCDCNEVKNTSASPSWMDNWFDEHVHETDFAIDTDAMNEEAGELLKGESVDESE